MKYRNKELGSSSKILTTNSARQLHVSSRALEEQLENLMSINRKPPAFPKKRELVRSFIGPQTFLEI